MTILTTDSLEFAREHITKYYDSDFFPKPVEFDALWHNWPAVVKDLTSKNVGKIWTTPPRIMAVPKPRGGYRVVHQLEPLDSVVYTALAAEVMNGVEAARIPAAEKVACSYRFKKADGSFFGTGTGWADFENKTEELAVAHKFVLATDITDFYNQISLHRLNNALEHADAKLKLCADDIESFISALNNKASQGIPIGPAASIVMAEAALMDIDEFIIGKGFKHTRYVDDFRIFADTRAQLQKHLEDLTIYLYDSHRLTLSSEKTSIELAAEYVEKYLHNDFVLQKGAIFKKLVVLNPYTNEEVEVKFEEMDEDEAAIAQLQEGMEQLLKFKHVDLGLARSILRVARRNGIADLADTVVDKFAFFAPVINDAALYLHEVTDSGLAKLLKPKVAALVSSAVATTQLVRYWLEWYVTQHAEFMAESTISGYVYSGPNIDSQARGSITTANLAWVRAQKSNIYNLGGWARRSVLNAARVLPSDERNHWLKLCIDNSPVSLDRWVASWVRDTA